MPIEFRDTTEIDDCGLATFLRIERSGRGSTYLGSLFTINVRGEPIELVYNALETPHPLLWRPTDLRRHAERRLVASLLSAAESEPRLLFCLADEVGVELFSQDIQVRVTVGRVERSPHQGGATESGDGALPSVPDAMHIFWQPGPPAEESSERALFEQLGARGLLLEPFDRAADALREVYGPREPG